MSDFKEVSLGFAEFVSQLIQETFDAILSSQNYQLEKFAEIESQLNLSHAAFVDQYISQEEIEIKMKEYFGFTIQKQMEVDGELELFIHENLEAEDNLIYGGKLTTPGFEAITFFVENLLVEQRKGILNTIISNANSSNLVVDSGEITAKLELSNLFSAEAGASVDEDIPQFNLKSAKGIIKKAARPKEINLPTKGRSIGVLNFENDATGETTVLIDKSEAQNINNNNFQIPDVRLSVKPTKLSGSSNLYSEIKINFKTV